MSTDIPNAFVQTLLEQEETSERIMMKITGKMVDLLISIDPELYGPYVVYERGQRVLYILVLQAIYGMLISSVLWYNKFRKDLEKVGFEFNPYDPCIANRIVNGKQQTIKFHVDDLMSSHINPKVNNKFLIWLNMMYGDLGKVTATRGKVHDYLGMTLIFNDDGSVDIDMTDYIKKMIKDFPILLKRGDTVLMPAGDNLYSTSGKKKLDPMRASVFHTWTAKGLFVSKRARLDIQPTIAGLCT